MLGDRPCVRQSTLYRQHCGGNEMKSLLGQDQLKWDTTKVQGCYAGRPAYEFNGSSQDGPHAPSQAVYAPPTEGISGVGRNVPAENGNRSGSRQGMEEENSDPSLLPPTCGKPVNNTVYSHCRLVGGLPKYRSYCGEGGEKHPSSRDAYPLVVEDTYQPNVQEKSHIPPHNVSRMGQPSFQQSAPVSEVTPISGSRKLRPGAGYANKQSYNIFIGE